MELIPKQAPQIPAWLDILFYLSLGLLVFTLIGYFVLNQSLKTYQKTLEDLEATLSRQVSEQTSLKDEILTEQKKIKDFSVLINKHLKTSNVFNFLEKQCHPKVWFSEFVLDAKEEKVLLSGEAQDFESLGQQMLILRDDKLIKGANLQSVSMKKEGKIIFDLSLSFNSSIFK
jgi:hypothetical protein